MLAVGSVLAGYLNVPAAPGRVAFLEHFLEPSLHVPAMEGAHAAAEHADHAVEIVLMIVSSLIALAGIAIAASLYLKRTEIPGQRSLRGSPASISSLLHKGYIDELYDAALVQPIKALSEGVLWKADARVIDGAVNGSRADRRRDRRGSCGRFKPARCAPMPCRCCSAWCLIVGYYLWS